MFKVVKKKYLAPNVYLLRIEAPLIASSALPGQFLIVIADEFAERIPLTIADFDKDAGTVDIVVQSAGTGTQKINAVEEGQYVRDIVGPLGVYSEFVNEDLEELKKKNYIFVSGGIGAAPVYAQVKWFKEHGLNCDVIIGAKSEEYIIFEEKMRAAATNVYTCTDDGSYGFKGNVTDMLNHLVKAEGKKYDRCVAIGPMVMMKFVSLTTKELNIPTIVSLNPIMVDGTGMCGACRVNVGGEVKFACVEGPEFDGHLVDFDNAMKRQRQYMDHPEELMKEKDHKCNLKTAVENAHRAFEIDEEIVREIKKNRFTKIPVPEQNPHVRNQNFEEVSLGYDYPQAVYEANRCLDCKVPHCVEGCPVSIDIPGFIREIAKGRFDESAKVLAKYTSLPAVCGRVCPQEKQCEERCVLKNRGDSVSIGKLERFAADYARENNVDLITKESTNGIKVAIIGAGPAGLTCAGELAKKGYDVTIFEALHLPGGVLVYGIPEFRLPDDIVLHEVENLKKLGVKIKNDIVIGRTVTVDQLFEEGFESVFIGSGAGLPIFMNIPGESLNGVFSANEFLTRNNLMKSFKKGYDTPVNVGKTVAVVGGGNVAMDAARVAKRLGADVKIIYRRTEKELPARAEEVHHAMEEGIEFLMLTNPVKIIGDDTGWVKKIEVIKNELGEPDDSGRRSPVPIKGSEYEIDVETVIMALGTRPNPLIASTTKGLSVNNRNCIIANERGETTREGVFAGGDAVTGAATVILAMGAGKEAANAIDEYLKNKRK